MVIMAQGIRHRAAVRRSMAAVVAMALLGACGERSTVASLDRPLTERQAVQLASSLYRNYGSGGAHIDARVPYSATVSVEVTGNVDFQARTGHLEVFTSTKGAATSTQQIDYTTSGVYEAKSDPALPGGVGWTMRIPDPATRPLDRIIQVIVGLASPQPADPRLLAQGPARFTGSRSFSGITVNLYRYSPSIIYWVGASDGLLYRFIGTVPGIAGPVTVDVTQRGAHATPPPDPSLLQPAG